MRIISRSWLLALTRASEETGAEAAVSPAPSQVSQTEDATGIPVYSNTEASIDEDRAARWMRFHY
jgi:hypothetical protein